MATHSSSAVASSPVWSRVEELLSELTDGKSPLLQSAEHSVVPTQSSSLSSSSSPRCHEETTLIGGSTTASLADEAVKSASDVRERASTGEATSDKQTRGALPPRPPRNISADREGLTISTEKIAAPTPPPRSPRRTEGAVRVGSSSPLVPEKSLRDSPRGRALPSLPGAVPSKPVSPRPAPLQPTSLKAIARKYPLESTKRLYGSVSEGSLVREANARYASPLSFAYVVVPPPPESPNSRDVVADVQSLLGDLRLLSSLSGGGKKIVIRRRSVGDFQKIAARGSGALSPGPVRPLHGDRRIPAIRPPVPHSRTHVDVLRTVKAKGELEALRQSVTVSVRTSVPLSSCKDSRMFSPKRERHDSPTAFSDLCSSKSELSMGTSNLVEHEQSISSIPMAERTASVPVIMTSKTIRGRRKSATVNQRGQLSQRVSASNNGNRVNSLARIHPGQPRAGNSAASPQGRSGLGSTNDCVHLSGSSSPGSSPLSASPTATTRLQLSSESVSLSNSQNGKGPLQMSGGVHFPDEDSEVKRFPQCKPPPAPPPGTAQDDDLPKSTGEWCADDEYSHHLAETGSAEKEEPETDTTVDALTENDWEELFPPPVEEEEANTVLMRRYQEMEGLFSDCQAEIASLAAFLASNTMEKKVILRNTMVDLKFYGWRRCFDLFHKCRDLGHQRLLLKNVLEVFVQCWSEKLRSARDLLLKRAWKHPKGIRRYKATCFSEFVEALAEVEALSQDMSSVASGSGAELQLRQTNHSIAFPSFLSMLLPGVVDEPMDLTPVEKDIMLSKGKGKGDKSPHVAAKHSPGGGGGGEAGDSPVHVAECGAGDSSPVTRHGHRSFKLGRGNRRKVGQKGKKGGKDDKGEEEEEEGMKAEPHSPGGVSRPRRATVLMNLWEFIRVQLVMSAESKKINYSTTVRYWFPLFSMLRMLMLSLLLLLPFRLAFLLLFWCS